MNEVIYYNYNFLKKRLTKDKKIEKSVVFCMIKEDEEEYKLDIEQPHDKVYRIILSNKEEAAKFINKSLKIQKSQLKGNDIENIVQGLLQMILKLKNQILYTRKKVKIYFF